MLAHRWLCADHAPITNSAAKLPSWPWALLSYFPCSALSFSVFFRTRWGDRLVKDSDRKDLSAGQINSDRDWGAIEQFDHLSPIAWFLVR
jgi:hypothetical protein